MTNKSNPHSVYGDQIKISASNATTVASALSTIGTNLASHNGVTATTSVLGHVTLCNTYNSSWTNVAATPAIVNAAWQLANTANTTATSAKSTADSASSTASTALSTAQSASSSASSSIKNFACGVGNFTSSGTCSVSSSTMTVSGIGFKPKVVIAIQSGDGSPRTYMCSGSTAYYLFGVVKGTKTFSTSSSGFTLSLEVNQDHICWMAFG